MYAPNGTPLISQSGRTNSEIVVSAPETGTYVLIAADELGFYTGSYGLYLLITPHGDIFPTRFNCPAQVNQIEGLNISWTAENHGDGTISNTWNDAVYLSDDGQWDAADLKLSSETVHFSLSPGQNYSVSTTLHTSSVLQNGTYYIILKTDDLNNVNESKEWNNDLINPLKIGSDGAFTESASHQSAITADLMQRKTSITLGAVDGDLSGSFNVTPFGIVTITSGSFEGQGFFNGIITTTLDNIVYNGDIRVLLS